MTGRVAGKVVAITGGASGLGEATARLMVSEGASVVIADIQDDRGAALAAGLGPAATYLRCDVTREADVAALIKQQRDGRFKVSVRSRGRHDLSAVASTFGGGGHRLAAGYTSSHGPQGTIERLAAALRGDPVAP